MGNSVTGRKFTNQRYIKTTNPVIETAEEIHEVEQPENATKGPMHRSSSIRGSFEFMPAKLMRTPSVTNIMNNQAAVPNSVGHKSNKAYALPMLKQNATPSLMARKDEKLKPTANLDPTSRKAKKCAFLSMKNQKNKAAVTKKYGQMSKTFKCKHVITTKLPSEYQIMIKPGDDKCHPQLHIKVIPKKREKEEDDIQPLMSVGIPVGRVRESSRRNSMVDLPQDNICYQTIKQRKAKLNFA